MIRRFLKPNALYLITIVMVVMLSSCRKDTASGDIYTCPMHPTVVSNKPGACPVCNMELVKKVEGAEVTFDPELAAAATPPNEKILSSIRTVRGNFTALPVAITRQGVVTYDPRNLATVSARVAGRVEKSYLKYVYQNVRKGDRILEIYSPELVTAQREWLLALTNDPDNESLLAAAKDRLRLLGMTDQQIATVGKSREALEVIPVYSPVSGIVVQRSAQAPMAPASTAPAASSMSDMAGQSAGSASSTNNAAATDANNTDLLREGTYVNAGQTMFAIVDLSSLLVEVNVPATAAGNIRAGDELRVLFKNNTVKTSVDMVQPFSQGGEQFIKVRSYVRDGKLFTVGQLITVTLNLPPVEGLWLPAESLYDLGTRQVAFVKQNGFFQPVEVITGISTNDHIMVISGIASGDEVASNAQFMVDNEGFIKTK